MWSLRFRITAFSEKCFIPSILTNKIVIMQLKQMLHVPNGLYNFQNFPYFFKYIN